MDDPLERLREAELTEAARHYGVDVLFGRFPDYGEGRTPTQVFDDAWDRDASELLLVWVLRALRPTIVASMHPREAPDSSAHRAASELVETALLRAADPTFHAELGASLRVERHLFANGQRLG